MIFGGHLDPGERPALLLIDPARAYTEPGSPLYAGVEDAVDRMRELLALVRAAGLPVIITRVRHEQPGDGGLFARKVPGSAAFAAGNPLAEPIAGLEHRPGEMLLTKQYPSAFFGTALAASLTARRIDTLLIAGLSTSGCVRASALDALQHGFVPLVVREAVGDRDPAIHEANLNDIAAKIADVVLMNDLPYLKKGVTP
ncbi:isochorismatase family protein [Actinoplanes derwentensis]|uniref:Maleamate amidohydrolase n=1 Tax=Actinoplanes derwentensis TaxID=113562 RepID=A0A1H1ZRQ1_9ACTN|nr:isochorismatase family protein [Actinoplanes derwentensis]GID89184.1 N-carbamoylsarcosine amidase [Actinoplanes derwentensis]SDT36465.1 maleamate amidohydrolase [Actinoplanes derwentensis]